MMGFFDRGKGPVASAKGGTNNASRERESWMDDPDAIRDRRERKPPPGPPGGGKVWDWSNQEWADMPNLNPRRPWSRTPSEGSRTGDPNERIEHFPGSASGEWNPHRYRMDENGNWVPRPTGYGGIPLNDDGKPIYTPDPTRYPEYFAPGSGRADTAEETRQYEAERRSLYESLPGYVEARAAWQAAKASGDRSAEARAFKRAHDIMNRGMTSLKQRGQLERFIAQGGTEQTWNDRFKTEWPVPKSPLGTETHNPNGGGAPAPTGGGDRALPPTANPMMQGYQPSGNDVIAALSRIQSMPIGAPTAANSAQGGFAKAASTTKPKAPTVVRRGGGRVDRAA